MLSPIGVKHFLLLERISRRIDEYGWCIYWTYYGNPPFTWPSRVTLFKFVINCYEYNIHNEIGDGYIANTIYSWFTMLFRPFWPKREHREVRDREFCTSLFYTLYCSSVALSRGIARYISYGVTRMTHPHQPILFIFGCTGTGKSDLGVEAALKYGGEVL